MESDRADFDNVAWDRHDEVWEKSQRFFRLVSTIRELEDFLTTKFGKKATWITPVRIGGYNNLWRMRIDGTHNDDIIIRLPQPIVVKFPEEKTIREAATTNFIAQNTKIPVPRVDFHASSNSDCEFGPYTITSFVEHRNTMSHALTLPHEDPWKTHMLNPDISEEVLQGFYKKVTPTYLELFKPKFPRIGSLAQTSENTFSVSGRPITQNMNNMIQLANIPRGSLPPRDKTYGTADEWYIALAEMHIAQLVFQHNDLVTSADDCRTKYVARQLFLDLAKQGRLSTFGFLEDDWSAQFKSNQSSGQIPKPFPAPSGSSSFRLWCDDLRAGNVLLNDADDVVAVVDWEFTYVAPTQFSLDPPWWLLLDVPEMWHTDIDDWARIYDNRLLTWLRALEKAEESIGTPKDLNAVRLSAYMRESWATGRFWLNYAAKKSWAFDTIFWKHLDEKFFGMREVELGLPRQLLWKTRVHLLSEKKRIAMEAFVERKMEESKERILVDWNDKEVRQRLAEVIIEG